MGDRINDALAPRKSYPERKVIELPTSVLGRYAGVYQLPSNANLAIVVNDRRIRIAADNPLAPHFNIVIALQEKQLKSQIPGQQFLPLYATSETRFFTKATDAQIDFRLEARGRFNLVSVQSFDVLHQESDVDAERVPERQHIDVSPSTLEGYAGTYQLQPGINVLITVENGQLVAQVGGAVAESTSTGRIRVELLRHILERAD